MTTTATAATQPVTQPDGAGTIVAFGGRIRRAVRRRAGRLQLALLTFVLFLPLLATSLLGRH